MSFATSFTGRILFWMGLIALLPFLVFGLPAYHFVKEAALASEEAHLHSHLAAQSQGLQEWLKSVGKDLLFVGRSNCVLGLCDKDHPGRKTGGCPFIGAILASHPSYRAISAFGPEWNLIARAGGNPDCVEETHFEHLRKEARSGEGLTVSPESCNDDGRTIITVLQVARKRDGTPKSYVAAVLDLSLALPPLASIGEEYRDTEKLFILDGRGRYLIPPAGRGDLWGKKSIMSVDAGRSGDHVTRFYNDFKGVPVLGASVSIPGTEWLLASEIDTEAAFAQTKMLLRRIVLAAGLTLFLALAGSLVTSRRLSRPLESLSGVADEISAGNEQARAPSFDVLEAHKVGTAFNRMLDSIRESRQAIARSASLAAVGELSSRIVHEMRNPLSSIKLSLQGLHQGRQDRDMEAESAGTALEQLDRLEHLMEDILHFGRPLVVRPVEVTFDRLVATLRRTLGNEVLLGGVSLTDDDGLAGRPLRVDPELMNQTLGNLVTNAAQWSPPGGKIRLRAEPVEGRKGRIRITVEDEGPGIPAADREKVFGIFFSRRDGGTGLGLANVRKIVELHGGTVSVGESPGGGGAFTVELPAPEEEG